MKRKTKIPVYPLQYIMDKVYQKIKLGEDFKLISKFEGFDWGDIQLRHIDARIFYKGHVYEIDEEIADEMFIQITIDERKKMS